MISLIYLKRNLLKRLVLASSEEVSCQKGVEIIHVTGKKTVRPSSLFLLELKPSDFDTCDPKSVSE